MKLKDTIDTVISYNAHVCMQYQKNGINMNFIL